MFRPHIHLRPQHHHREQEVGAFGDDLTAVFVDGGDHGFDGLFADLLGDLLATPCKHLCHVGFLRVGVAARFDDREDPLDDGTTLVTVVHVRNFLIKTRGTPESARRSYSCQPRRV